MPTSSLHYINEMTLLWKLNLRQ